MAVGSGVRSFVDDSFEMDKGYFEYALIISLYLVAMSFRKGKASGMFSLFFLFLFCSPCI